MVRLVLAVSVCAAASDEEPVDVMPAIRKACEPKCEQSFNAYQACLDRVKAKGVGACDGQYFDFLHCIDKCVRLTGVVAVCSGS
ncbi:Ubiquinol-cytochrome C reductase hinge domain [Phytophthora cactorum]|nr:Ubiquinol-cytochrome C reductase hinge domain [Phytophthora cactorum]